MRVIIEAPLLISAQVVQNPLALPSLFDLCLDQECHSIEVEPPDAPELQTWRSTLSQEQWEEIKLLLDESVQRQLREPPTTVIRVADVPAVDWGEDPPRLPLRDAKHLLRKPLRVLIEGINDEAFLRTSVPQFYRARFEDWSRREILKLEHRGGLQNLEHAIEQDCKQRERRPRMFVMFDSDARKRDEPSSESKRVARVCVRQKLAHHMLRRRAIDNYIPPPAIERWLKQNHAREFDTIWLPRLRAFRGLTDKQRHHYNMKHGLKRDREGGGLANIFDSLSSQTPDPPLLLEVGFGETVARAFREDIPAAWFEADGQKPELMSLFEKILSAA